MRAVALVGILLAAATAAAQQREPSAEASPPGLDLPPDVRALLVQEMNAISQASQAILDALVRGQHEVVEQQALLIRGGFILEQELTPEGREALETGAPPDFLEQDEAFHALAERLADAAGRRDRAAETMLFAQMLDACVACHAEHAADRFPGLVE